LNTITPAVDSLTHLRWLLQVSTMENSVYKLINLNYLHPLVLIKAFIHIGQPCQLYWTDHHVWTLLNSSELTAGHLLWVH